MFHMKHRFVWFCSKHVSDEAPSRLVLYKTYVTCSAISSGCDSAMFHMKHRPESAALQSGRHLEKKATEKVS